MHSGSKIDFGIIEILKLRFQNLQFLELVHRLDKETSGILLIAKNRFTLKELQKQLFLNRIKKEYIVLVKGHWNANLKKINISLSKSIYKKIKNKNFINYYKKKSITFFSVKKYFFNTTLINAYPITGRTHQIRIHTQYAKHPIVLDKRYGDHKFNKEIFNLGLNRLFLHSYSITIKHPRTMENKKFFAPLDKNLILLLKKLINYKN
ncbi:MAG: pseudouridine synthase [Arsenophonus sp.]|nr:MAG: pseudouridine synthase [Arsenophonus sp.]